MIVSMLGIILSLLGILPHWMTLVGLLCFVTSFAIGLGPIPWLIVAELFDAKYVATAMSIACIVNWTCNFLVGLSFPFCQKYLGPYSFAPFCFILTCSVLFIYLYLPETHGKSVEEIYKQVSTPSSSFYQPQSLRNGDRRSTMDMFEESIVDMPVIQAVEMLKSHDSWDEEITAYQTSTQPQQQPHQQQSQPPHHTVDRGLVPEFSI